MSKSHVLIVDDEPALQHAIAKYLLTYGYQVSCLNNALEFDPFIKQHTVDLVILDQVMPGEDGLSITRRIRASGNPVPILMLSAFADDTDRIVGLEMGVDDYLAKPPNLREVLARVKALLRRSQGHVDQTDKDHSHTSQAKGALQQQHNEYCFGPYQLSIDKKQLLKNRREIKLTDTDFRLLKLFVENPYKELSRDLLSETLKGYKHEPFDRSIDVQVKRLRGKIEEDRTQPQYIITVWRTGYQFLPSGRVSSEISI